MASPCAACKFLRRKCTNGCVFAPYFPPDQPDKFSNVHKIFGASNVAKLLNELPPPQREDAVNSLAYEAKARITDPVYGCVSYINLLQLRIKDAQEQLLLARKELAAYTGPSVFSHLSATPVITQGRLLPATSSTYMPGSIGLPNAGIGMDLGLGSSGAMSSHPGVSFRDAFDTQQFIATETGNLYKFNMGMRGGYDGQINTNQAASVQGAVELVSAQPAPIHHQNQNPQPLPQQQLFDGVFLARPPPQQQMRLQTQQQTQPQAQAQAQLEVLFMEQIKQQQQQHNRVGSDEGRSCIRPCLP